MEKEKSAAALLQEKLCYKPTQAAMKLSEEEIAQADRYCEDYKKFLDAAKTEREAVRAAVAAAEAAGFRAFDRKAPLKAGDKVRFEKVSIQEAQQALLNQRAALRTLRRSLDM